ncbi:MAG: FecR family protein [Defluviitaleaceae bacterium]|nr:FecR family protein [Defluviitaleaceae bacterium]
MKKNFVRRIATLSVAAVIAFGATAAVMANEARQISIHNISGNNVELTRGARAATPREGQRLAQGNMLTTGRDSAVYLTMDSNSILKMDQQSQVVVSSAGNRLALTVQSGSALFNVGAQQAGQTTEVRIGNTGLTVRGTMFTASRVGDSSVIHMLSGLGEVETGLIHPGYTLVVTEQVGGDIARIYPTVIEELDLFTLQAISDNAEYLTVYGVVTPELLEALPTLKDRAETRENAVQASVDRILAIAVANVSGIPLPQTGDSITDGGAWDGGYVAGGTTPTPPPPGGIVTPPPGAITPPPGGGAMPPPPPFVQIPASLLVSGTGSGGLGNSFTVTMNGTINHVPPVTAYDMQMVLLTAGNREGYEFSHWHFYSPTSVVPGITTNPVWVTITNHDVIVRPVWVPDPSHTPPPPPPPFVQIPASITVSGSSAGPIFNITMNATATHVPPTTAHQMQSVSLNAGNREGYVFSHWHFYSGGSPGLNTANNPINFPMPNQDVLVRPVWVAAH